MTTEITVSEDEREQKRKLALLKAIGFDKLAPEQRELALNISRKYELDPLLRHVVIVDGKPFITRDALLFIAHRSGQFDGIEVTKPVLVGDYWEAEATVYRRDMSHAIRYPGRYPAKGKNTAYAPEMAIKVAESMALRRAFNVAAPVVEEAWDRDIPEPPVAPQSLAERVAQKRQVLAANHELPPAAIEDGEPDVLDEPMSEAESAAIPLMCGAEDKSLDTGECEQLPGHSGPHRNAGGVWPNK